MSAGREPVLPDDALDRLARELFAAVQGQHPQMPPSEAADDTAGDVGTNLPKWLLEASEEAAKNDSGDWRPCTASTPGKGREGWAAMHA